MSRMDHHEQDDEQVPVYEAPLPAPVAAEAAPPVVKPRDTAAPVSYEAPVIAEACRFLFINPSWDG